MALQLYEQQSPATYILSNQPTNWQLTPPHYTQQANNWLLLRQLPALQQNILALLAVMQQT
jgi:hypothetical protein